MQKPRPQHYEHELPDNAEGTKPEAAARAAN